MRAAANGCMTGQSWPLNIGGRLVIDGETITVTSVDGTDVQRIHGGAASRSGSC